MTYNVFGGMLNLTQLQLQSWSSRKKMRKVNSSDVTKFEFDDVRTSNVFTRFETRQMFKALCCRMRIHGKILVLRLISYAQTARERRQTCFFLRFNLSHKLQ